jgi:hypothetical protein
MAIRTRTILRETIGLPTEAAILELSQTALQGETSLRALVCREDTTLSKAGDACGRHETLTKLALGSLSLETPEFTTEPNDSSWAKFTFSRKLSPTRSPRAKSLNVPRRS